MCCRRGFHSRWKHHHHQGGFHHPAKRWLKDQIKSGWTYPPVNVQELEDRYELFMYAAGYEKSDFSVLVNDNALVISVEKPEKEDQDLFNWRRFEFRQGKFQRRFELDDRVDKEAIKAEYNEGILTVVLPKLPGFTSSSQEIQIN